MLPYLELSLVHVLKKYSKFSSGATSTQTELCFQTIFHSLDDLQDYRITTTDLSREVFAKRKIIKTLHMYRGSLSI